MSDRLPWTNDLAFRGPLDGLYRRTIRAVEESLGEVACCDKVGEPELVLDADCIAPLPFGQAGSGNVHPALFKDLPRRQVRCVTASGLESHPLLREPSVHVRGIFGRDESHRVIER